MFEAKHRLAQFISALQKNDLVVESRCDEQACISHISFDTREMAKDTLFAIKGRHFKLEYIDQAHESGAVVFVVEEGTDAHITLRDNTNYSYIAVSSIRSAMPIIALVHTDNAASSFDFVGITGTKGKTTTSFFVKSIFDAMTDEPNCGISSTVVYYDGSSYKGATLTTPEPFTLHDVIATAHANGLKNFVMEVSSQALKYQRVESIRFKVGCCINIGLDHISEYEHPTFEDYLESKLKIYAQSDIAVVNLDQDYASECLDASANCERIITYSTKDTSADFYSYGEHINADGRVEFTAVHNGGEFTVVLGTAGFFNVSNALAALAITSVYDVPLQAQLEGLLTSRIPGHMDIQHSEDNRVITCVDYAHNKISFEAIFESFRREYPNRKIIAVYGSGGDKAKNRRKELAEVSANGADFNLITEEDPAYEGAESVCAEIVSNLGDVPHMTIIDRATAIRHAIFMVDELCTPEDEGTLVLILGKGNETYSYDKGVYAPYDGDDVVTLKFLEEYNAQRKVLC